MKSMNKYTYESCLLHEECKSLYKKSHKLLITNEVLYKLFKNENNIKNCINNTTMYQKILNFFGCY